MTRYIGAIFIIAASVAMGLNAVRRLRDRVHILNAITQSLFIMHSEICTRLVPIKEVLDLLAKDGPEETKTFFRGAAEGMNGIGQNPFAKIWFDVVQNSRELLLTDEESAVLACLGFTLGRYDVEEQSAAIERTRQKFEAFLQKAEMEQTRDTKSNAFLSITAGLFAVIILL